LNRLHATRAAIIFNPVARTISRRRHMLQRTIEVLRAKGIDASLVATEGPKTAGGQARRQIDAGCNLIIAAGGDGTINEVAEGMLHTGVPLGILPGGTANVLAREMRMPRTIVAAAQNLTEYTPLSIAVGRIVMASGEKRSFLCMAGAGLDAGIVARVNADLKARAGKLAYYLTGFGQVFTPLPEFPVIVDGKRYEASFALISRVRNYGGDLEIARGASLLRPDFQVVLFRGTESVKYLRYLAGVVGGRVAEMEGCTVLHASRIECPGGQGIFVQIDGELAGQLPVKIDIVPDAVSLLMPPRFVALESSLPSVTVCA
jgi:YegS/Rv2252/BmrU family lipid kinase